MAQNTDFGQVANDLRNAATQFAALTSSATVLGAALHSFREFEKQLVSTNAIAGGTVAQLEQMKTAARDFSLVTTVAATDAGRALQQLAQAGFSAQQSLNAMSGVLLLAQATFSDVGVTSDVLSSNIRAFKLEAQDTTRIANVFAAAITGSLATMDKLAFAFRQVAPVAELAKLSIEETTASLAVLFNVGLRGEQAGTALRNIIIRLVRPLGEAGELLKSAGIATRTANGDLRNLADIMSDIADSDLSNSDLARIFETEALAGVRAYISALKDVEINGKSAYENLLQDITNTDRAVELAAANLDTFDGSLRLLGNTVSDIQKDLGEALAPVIISIADTVRNLAEGFRDLDPEIQQSIATTVAFGTAATGLLLTLGLLATSLRAIGAVHLVRLVASVGVAIPSFAALNGVLGVFLLRVGAATIGLKALSLSSTGTLVPALRGLTVNIGAAAAALRAFSITAAILTPAGLIAVGAAAVATAAIGMALAFDVATTSVEEFESALDFSRDTFKIEATTASASADRILGKGLEKEISARVQAVQRQLQILSVASPQDRLAFLGRKQESGKDLLDENNKLLEEYIGEFDQSVLEAYELERKLNAGIAEYRESHSAIYNSTIGSIAVQIARDDALGTILNELSGAQKAQLDVLRQRGGSVVDSLNEAKILLEDLQEQEIDSVKEFFALLDTGRLNVKKENAAALDLIQREGLLQGIDLSELVEAVTAPTGAFTEQELLRAILEKSGAVPADVIVELFKVYQEDQEELLLSSLKGLTSNLKSGVKGIEADLAKQRADDATTIAEAVRLATEGGLKQLELDMSDLSEKLKGQYADILVDFGVDFREDVMQEIQASVGEVIDLGDDAPGFSELVDGSWLIDSINKQIDESTTLSDAEKIVSEEFIKYSNIFAAYIDAMIAAGTIDSATADSIRAAVAESTKILQGKFLEGLGGVADETVSQTKRVERANKLSDRAGSARLSAAQKALARERKIEDLYAEIADITRDTREALFNATRGIDLSDREGFLLDLEVDEVVADYTKQIRTLQRKLEDVEIGFEGTPDQLAEIKAGYSAVLVELEAAKDAEIKAASSFTSMMARRSAALDLFRRDLQDVAFATKDTASKIGAGITIAFADYQENLVTLTSITKDAVSSTLDALTTGIADFIFENENAWESFKSSMLRISRDIFEGFTEALLQQGISSLTGGGGSLLSNALQPGKGKGDGVPSVGNGGLLGALFPELLQSGSNAKTDRAQGDDTQTILTQFNSGMRQAVDETIAAMQSIARDFKQFDGTSTGITAVDGVPSLAAGYVPSGGAPATQSAAYGYGANPLSPDLNSLQDAVDAVANSTKTILQKAVASLGLDIRGSGQVVASQIRFGGSSAAGGLDKAGVSISRAADNAARKISASGDGDSGDAKSGLGGTILTAALSGASSIIGLFGGGRVRGPGTTTSDSIPAMLSDEEYVVRASSANPNLGLLELLNDGASQETLANYLLNKNGASKFAYGGSVTLNTSNTSLSSGGNSPVTKTAQKNQTSGNTIQLSVNYYIQGSPSDAADSFKKSGDQQAKVIATDLRRAQKNM